MMYPNPENIIVQYTCLEVALQTHSSSLPEFCCSIGYGAKTALRVLCHEPSAPLVAVDVPLLPLLLVPPLLVSLLLVSLLLVPRHC